MARCTQGNDDNFVYFILDLNNNTLLSCEASSKRFLAKETDRERECETRASKRLRLSEYYPPSRCVCDDKCQNANCKMQSASD